MPSSAELGQPPSIRRWSAPCLSRGLSPVFIEACSKDCAIRQACRGTRPIKCWEFDSNADEVIERGQATSVNGTERHAAAAAECLRLRDERTCRQSCRRAALDPETDIGP